MAYIDIAELFQPYRMRVLNQFLFVVERIYGWQS